MNDEAVKKFDMRGVGLRVALRSFLFETLWNYRTMQGVGFGFTAAPAFRRLFIRDDEYRDAMSRHTDLVNTHPSMAPLLTGITARLEAEVDGVRAATYRKRVMTTLAAYGDRLLWNHLRPFAALAGAAFALASAGSAYGVLILLALYNIPQLILRGTGFSWGWRQGLKALDVGNAPRALKARSFMRGATAFLSGTIFGVGVLSSLGPLPYSGLEFLFPFPVYLLIAPVCVHVCVRLGAPLTPVLYVAVFGALAICRPTVGSFP